MRGAGRHGVAECVETGLRRRVVQRADVAARDRIQFVAIQAPALEHGDVGRVEIAEAAETERAGRAQFGGAQRGQRTVALAQVRGDRFESLGHRQHVREPGAHDLEPGQRDHSGREWRPALEEGVVRADGIVYGCQLEFLAKGPVVATMRDAADPRKHPGQAMSQIPATMDFVDYGDGGAPSVLHADRMPVPAPPPARC